MKKSIFILSFALVLFSNVVAASTPAIASVSIERAQDGDATPLAAAIAKGDIISVKAFIAYGIDINEKNNDMTPLMLAARYNQIEIITLLLEHGASLKETNTKGFNALKYAQLSNANDAVVFITKQTSVLAMNKKRSQKPLSI